MWASDGVMMLLFMELLPTKLGNRKSCTVLSRFSFIQLMIAGTKLVAKSFLQAVTAALTACCSNSFFSSAVFFRVLNCFFLERKLHLLVDVRLTKLLFLLLGLRALVVKYLPRGTVSGVVHMSILLPLVQRESLKFVQGPVEKGVPLGPHRRSRAFGCKLVLLLLQKEREPFTNV